MGPVDTRRWGDSLRSDSVLLVLVGVLILRFAPPGLLRLEHCVHPWRPPRLLGAHRSGGLLEVSSRGTSLFCLVLEQ